MSERKPPQPTTPNRTLVKPGAIREATPDGPPAPRRLVGPGDIGKATRTPQDPPAPERVAAHKLGLGAESKAAMLLLAKGFRILARRWRSGHGEVDIVAANRSTLVFVEVKARGRLDDAAEAVTVRQRRRIATAAAAWLAAHPEHAQFDVRFDAILVAPGHLPRHMPGAFDADG